MSHVPEYGGAPASEAQAYRGGAYPGAGGSLDIGATLSEAFGIFGRRFVPLVLLMLAIFVPLFLVGIALVVAVGAGGSQVGIVVASVITGFLFLIASLLAQTAATVAVVDDLRRQPFSIGSALNVTARRLIPVLGVTLLAGLAIIVGLVLLVVPGLILTVMFYVAVPVCVVERAGATDSLGRSGFLTKGQRWQVFGLVVIVGIAGAVLGGVIEFVGQLFGTIPGAIIKVLWQSVIGAFGAVLVAVVYYRLRMLKEGVDITAIANVFD